MAEWFKIITDPEVYITLEVAGLAMGIYFLFFLAFAESALFAGLLYSSDSFLFIAGIYSHLLVNQLMPVESENYFSIPRCIRFYCREYTGIQLRSKSRKLF